MLNFIRHTNVIICIMDKRIGDFCVRLKKMRAAANVVSGKTIKIGWLDANKTGAKAFSNLQERKKTGKPTNAIGKPASLALIARTLNYGREAGETAEGHKYPAIPARPFLDVMKQRHMGPARTLFRKLLSDLHQKPSVDEVNRIMNMMGVVLKGQMQRAIRDSDKYVPKSPLTIKSEKRNGKTSERPLIDTGLMVNSVDYQIK